MCVCVGVYEKEGFLFGVFLGFVVGGGCKKVMMKFFAHTHAFGQASLVVLDLHLPAHTHHTHRQDGKTR